MAQILQFASLARVATAGSSRFLVVESGCGHWCVERQQRSLSIITYPNVITTYFSAQTNTVFVEATTVFSISILLAVVFLWRINRKFHLRKKHIYDKEPLQTPAKMLRRAGTYIRKKKENAESPIPSKAEEDSLFWHMKYFPGKRNTNLFRRFLKTLKTRMRVHL